MKRGFYTIITAQFFSSLADNALLIAAIAVLIEMSAPEWMRPLLKLFFTISYVMLAPFVGTIADSIPKGRVMFLTNNIKIFGCLLFFFHVHPLIAYAIVGFGAASYSPAKYGILTELLPPEKLIIANSWIESATVISILLGTLLGGLLISPNLSSIILNTNVSIYLKLSNPSEAALLVICLIYLTASIINFAIPKTGAIYKKQSLNPLLLTSKFFKNNLFLWKDKLGQISLSVTTLFWGAGATLQFIVLQWAEARLGMSLDKAAMLQGVVAVGIIFGAIIVAGGVSLKNSLRVLPMGVVLGLIIPAMTLISSLEIAVVLLIVVGALGGAFVVPMNALLQHRGHVILSAGQSIAAQNFNENANVLFMLGIYSLMIYFELSINKIIWVFGLFLAITMAMVIKRYKTSKQNHNLTKLIGDKRSATMQN
ncbi:MAG: lysophospholipid transporter LplT [Betaproteobacteria bacterium TMED41]|nr:MAG: lysophospholipid transporter LplT [Betaproteobacteria bacterium TMED41]